MKTIFLNNNSNMYEFIDLDYIPQKGDIVWGEFNQQIGHEQSGCRPALVVSKKNYNKKTGFCLAMPITKKIKGYLFEINVKTIKIEGAILTNQIRSFDFKSRKIKFYDKVDGKTLKIVMDKLNSLLKLK